MRRSLLVALLCACQSGGRGLEGYGRAADGNGPRVAWDLSAAPLPEIPFPNDLATRTDLSSPTGRRLNASIEAPTAFEQTLRQRMADLDGFGTFAPLWVKFQGRLDLANVATRQRGDADFADDAVLLINVTPGSSTYGEASVLDFGNGSFPVTVQKPDYYFRNDPRSAASNLIFDTYDERALGDGDDHCDVFEDRNQNGTLDDGEDLDGDGRLDVHEDTDSDGVCDVGNTWAAVLDDPSRNDPYADLISFYEIETDTLVFRPLVPLKERTTYAVVLSKSLVGESGEPVRSPWPYVHHLQQAASLKPLFRDGLLERHGLVENDVAFAWTFSTQSVTQDLIALREGLYGVGPLGHLGAAYPAELEAVVPVSPGDGISAYLLDPEELVDAVDLVFRNINVGTYDPARINSLLDTYGAVDYLVAGDYVSPDFLDAGGGVFAIDAQTGDAHHVPASLRFLMVVPKAEYGQAPFPVAMYCHGYTSMKLEGLAFAGVLAKFGIATFVIDAYSHGLPLGPQYDAVLQSLLQEFAGAGLMPFYDAVKKDRARDLNGDTFTDPGGDFWTNDTFHTRDIVRQTVVDYLQAIRTLRSFDGTQRWPFDLNGDGAPELAGDFNGDGQVDVGGPDAAFFSMGTSMGGILSSIIGALDPAIRAAAPISPGGGLLEVGLRTDLGNVVRAVILPIMGPMVLTTPLENHPGIVVVEWLVNDVFMKGEHKIALIGRYSGDEVVESMRAGDIFRVENLRNGKVDEVVADANLQVRAHIAASKGDPIVITVWRPDGVLAPAVGSLVRPDATLVKRIDTLEFEIPIFQGATYAKGSSLVAIQEGLGYRRNTPSLRRLLSIAQTILEPADPVNWAPHYADPLNVLPEGARARNVLLTVTLGDMTVPASAGIALARSAGIIGYREADPRYGISQNQLLIDRHVVESIDERYYFTDDCCYAHCGQVNFDIDDLSNGQHASAPPRLAAPSSAVCSADVVCSASCEPLPPLRATVASGEGVNAVRFPALNIRGQHAVDLPNPAAKFDPSMFVLNQVGLFLSTHGAVLSDHPCLAANDCDACQGSDCPAIPTPTSMGAALSQ